MEDNTLAARAATGDQTAFDALVERYRRYVYTIAYKIALHEDDALDITQNVFLKLVEKIGDFDGRGTFRGWLATIATRETYTHLRRPNRRETATEPQILANIVEARQYSSFSSPSETLDRQQHRQLVEKAMKSLSPQQRAIFVMRFKEDAGPKEIGRALKIPAGQVRSQLHRAICRIRDEIARTAPGELKRENVR